MQPIRGRDAKGAYYRWGATGVKYHYVAGNKTSRERAKAKATEGSKRNPAERKTGGRTPRKPRKKTVSSMVRAKQKVADKSRVTQTAAYRRAAKRV